jgi:starch-binding outer membrane protein, SusD/RagB family
MSTLNKTIVQNMKSLNKILISSLFVILLITGCSEDFLDRPSLTDISAENFYKTPEELRLATAALYAGAQWGEWTYACYFPVGDVLSGNMALAYNDDAVQFNTFAITETNQSMIINWRTMYKVIAHCNMTIKGINENAPSSVPDVNKNAALAEAKFIRAYAYFNLAMLWQEVPIIEDNTALAASPLVNRHQVNDVYQFIVNDLTFAAEHLPATDKGRVTTWSAQGLLAKVYLTWAALKSPGVGLRDQTLLGLAKENAANVCENSGLELVANYADIFKTQFNDNPESLFAQQWHSSATGWLSGNMLMTYSNIKEISATGEGGGWFGISPTYNMFRQYSEQDSIRRKATFMLKGDHYPELNAAGGGYTFTGEAALKKHIVGTRADNSAPLMTTTSSPEHPALLRLADVYLLYAEAILGNQVETTDANAITYFNMVRKRAGVDTLNVGKGDKLTADILLKERRIEFAAESIFWFDLVRLFYSDSQKAKDFLNSQRVDRVMFTYDKDTFTYDKDTQVATPEPPLGAMTDASDGTFRFPLPASEVTANPKLSDAAVPYTFN